MTSRKNSKRPAPENECDRSRKRRRRTAFTDEQLDRLEDSFENEKFPGIQIREDLARELGIGEDRIQVWFQNRRARWRKREIKNKPAPALPAAKQLPDNSDVIPPAMFYQPPAIFSATEPNVFQTVEPILPFVCDQCYFPSTQKDAWPGRVQQGYHVPVCCYPNCQRDGPSSFISFSKPFVQPQYFTHR
ncbi:hypothetical protein OS493_000521 [Desmophyllum pertusum]|uniref:Homeobox domain-containing protein n=1 Tax=Desmophyllum pertusum TaxID=174260 RepID=A0A9X0A769_9CNID|nr:hypothetical protein OS493_000521 [Desmophyllum pertusum]